MKTLAGYVLNSKNPKRLPTTAPVIGVIDGFRLSAAIVKNVATITVTPDARPSKPSVKFTPFTVPSTTIKTKMINSHVGITNPSPLTNGILMDVSKPAILK